MALNDVLNDILEEHSKETVSLEENIAAESELPVLRTFDQRSLKALTINQDKQKVISSVLVKSALSKAVAAEVFTMLGSMNGEGLLNRLSHADTAFNMNQVAPVFQTSLAVLKEQEKSIQDDICFLESDLRIRAESVLSESKRRLCQLVDLEKTLCNPVLVVMNKTSLDLRTQPMSYLIRTDDALYDYIPFKGAIKEVAAKLINDPVHPNQGEDLLQLNVFDILRKITTTLHSVESIFEQEYLSNLGLATKLEMFENVIFAEKLLSDQCLFLDNLCALCETLRS